ncbi:LOW QUALITY PROTEIN: Hypothetical protein PHPALM_3124 [Phytophthora palmivora]|uniref:PiggyBac transposable element-derived protein domain-containing protein n=1 Tax=Phytophthora palmivora TaxID=4796 RepID=A0A2P4YN69_9STRA|nr:LOW QUALITY PROTEIN: Hypothetical protein PHPALM_3124 [Phytophthora palmivora]
MRVRGPQMPQDSSAEKTFKQVWRELSKQGWTYKKSTGLSDDHRYIPPSGSVKGDPGRVVTEVVGPVERVSNGVSLGDFDSPNFLDALKRDCLFQVVDSGDHNIAENDWLRALDSDAEGDEDSILNDEVDEEDGQDIAEGDDDQSEEDTVDVRCDGDIPLEFELTDDELTRLQINGWDIFDDQPSHQVLRDAAPLYDGPTGPTRAALAYAENTLAIFFPFYLENCGEKLQRKQSNFELRVYLKLHKKCVPKLVNDVKVSPPLWSYRLSTEAPTENPIQPHEIIRFIGLLIARTLEPRRESLSRHWITKIEGALARGTFGQFLSRDRFHDIARYLHFNDNAKQSDSGDRAFKIRPVIQALQKTFFRGFRIGARISFDEGNGADAPPPESDEAVHAQQAKQVGYKILYDLLRRDCVLLKVRLDIYCGKANADEDAVAQRAVVKNLIQVLRGQPAQRLICTDNFYTSIPLSHKLLGMGHSHVGTIRKDRKGWCLGIEFSQKRRHKRMPRGTYKMAMWQDHPECVGLTWMDNKPVRFLATGCSTRLTKVTRRERDGSLFEVPCPQLVRDYHETMGGEDTHDQLRLQRYSIQRSIRMRKYYKTILLGLVDLAMVNAFVVHKIAMAPAGKSVPTHAAFMRHLHMDLLKQTSEDFVGGG